jgi:hypothetical protein
MSYLTKTNTHHDQQVAAARKTTLQEQSVEEAESAIAVGTILSKNVAFSQTKISNSRFKTVSAPEILPYGPFGTADAIEVKQFHVQVPGEREIEAGLPVFKDTVLTVRHI